MKRTAFILTPTLFGLNTVMTKVGLSTTAPHITHILEVAASDKGFLSLRLSTVERNLINGEELR